MVITDHINLMPNPLIGPNIAELGPRFPDMHNCYDKELIAKATAIAEEENIKLQYGVYVGGTGPTFETQAEYRYFKNIGGDAAGMSTVPEVIVARHMSIPVFGVSVITNCGLSDNEVGDHEDVQRQGKKGRNQDGGALQAHDKGALEGMPFRAVPVLLRRWTDCRSGFLSRTFAAESSGMWLGSSPLYPGFGAGPLRRSAGCGFLPVRRVFIDNFNVIEYGK